MANFIGWSLRPICITKWPLWWHLWYQHNCRHVDAMFNCINSIWSRCAFTAGYGRRHRLIPAFVSSSLINWWIESIAGLVSQHRAGLCWLSFTSWMPSNSMSSIITQLVVVLLLLISTSAALIDVKRCKLCGKDARRIFQGFRGKFGQWQMNTTVELFTRAFYVSSKNSWLWLLRCQPFHSAIIRLQLNPVVLSIDCLNQLTSTLITDMSTTNINKRHTLLALDWIFNEIYNINWYVEDADQ